MRICILSATRWKQTILLLVGAVLTATLLRYPQAASNGVANGLAVCGKLLIPSLFPFLVLTSFLVQTGSLTPIERGLCAVCKRLCGKPSGMLTVWLISVLGGYPAGAVVLHEQLERGTIDERTARLYLGSCTHAAPAFVIGGVGIGMLGSSQAGALLLVAHLLSSIVVSLLYHTKTTPSSVCASSPVPVSKAVMNSIHKATATLIAMAGCVLTACCLLSLLDALGAGRLTNPCLRAGWSVCLEVTTGCMESVATGVHAPFFIGFALGFGGLCVMGQLAAIGTRSMIDRRFILMRITHGLLGGCLSLLLFKLFPPRGVAAEAVASFSHTNGSVLTGVSGTLLLMIMGVLFLATLPHDPFGNSRTGTSASL